MIKPTIKTLKQTHFGKKIYDNLITNYGEYFNKKNVNKTTVCVGKNIANK